MIQVYVPTRQNRASTKHNSCARKIRYATKEEADQKVLIMKTSYNEELETYSCPYCFGFHVGHSVPSWCRKVG
jgi:hypothetical protein